MRLAPTLARVVRVVISGFVALVPLALAPAGAEQNQTPAITTVVVGPNVNMGGGPASFTPPSTLIGDPFLQRQNEPSIAVSSRNPCHLLAGANDYRAVDIEEAAGEVGDAWLGVFKSFDCGATWTSTLLPGHKLDASPQGNNPIKGLAAAADATVRPGTSGLFYYSGIAFNRGEGGIGKVFVSRFVDNNNKDGGDPIQYLGMAQIDQGTAGQFLDKPWLVADIPRGDATCVINGRKVPAGAVYIVYTSFLGSGSNVHSKILFSRSTNCGASWSNPAKLSESVTRNQGTTIAIDPGTGAIHIAWREFATAGDVLSKNAIIVTRSVDGGRSFSKAVRLTPGNYQLQPFDQASSPLTFRTNAYPTIAVVPAQAEGRNATDSGRVYVAWSARGFGTARATDARILYSTSVGGAVWSAPSQVDDYPEAGHQIMPALAFAGGKLALAYYDLRDDASLGFDELVFEYGQAAFEQCSASFGPLGFAAVMGCIVTHPEGLSRRHTLDMRASMADAACIADGTCAFTSYSVVGGGSRKVSRYIEGRGSVEGPRIQLQYNRPNLPLFSKGRYPFIGDYIDIAGPTFVATPEGGWAWNTGKTANRPAPAFHVAWADNRNVGSPRNSNWEIFTPAVAGPNGVVCVPGQVGVRNQDVYTAQLRPGLIVSAPLNSKRIVGLQRSFVVIARNATTVERDYALEITPATGVIASFDQFKGFGADEPTGEPTSPVVKIFVRIPAQSSVSRTVFVALVNPPSDADDAPDVLVPVHVDELDAATGLPTGTFDMVYLNPDFENPDFENPDFENAELHNPDFENPDFENPDFENPDFENFTLSAASSIRNPDFENPDFENPDFENPDFENPDFENGSFEVADTTWPVRNDGNTTSAYKANVYVNTPPEGVKYQLVIRKLFENPAPVCAAPGSNRAPMTAQSVPLVNIVGPNVTGNIFDRNFNDASRDNATFALAPGERALITLRAYCSDAVLGCTRPLMASLEGDIALGVVAQGANCTSCVGDACKDLDMVSGPTECRIEDGPPKDVYDPIPPVITVIDPTLTTPDIIVIAADADNNGSEPVSVTLNVTDNLAVSSVQCTTDSTAVTVEYVGGAAYSVNGIFPLGANLLTCKAYDVREPQPNLATAAFTIDVRDVSAPRFGDPAFTFSTTPTGANGWYITTPVTGIVNVNDVSSLQINCTDTLNGTTVSERAITIQGDGIHDISCTATDSNNLSATAATTVKIDATPPSIATPFNIVAEATSINGASVVYALPTATDLIDATPNVSCVPSSGSNFAMGQTSIICTATDTAGNTSTSSFTITVRDTTPPIVTLAGVSPMTVEAGTTFVDAGATAVDAVSGVLAVTVTGVVNTATLGTYLLTYTATDAALNVGRAVRTVVIVDTRPPSSLTATVTPSFLWPPTGQITTVVVSGQSFDGGSGVASIAWKVIDEYRVHQPFGTVQVAGNGPFSFPIGLLNDRRGSDKDGRKYTITLTVLDKAGNALVLAQPLVVTIHDQSGK